MDDQVEKDETTSMLSSSSCHNVLGSYRRLFDEYQRQHEEHKAKEAKQAQERVELDKQVRERQKKLFHDSQFVEWKGKPYNCLKNRSKLSCSMLATAQHEKCKCQQMFGGRQHLHAPCSSASSMIGDALTYERCLQKGYLDNHELEKSMCVRHAYSAKLDDPHLAGQGLDVNKHHSCPLHGDKSGHHHHNKKKHKAPCPVHGDKATKKTAHETVPPASLKLPKSDPAACPACREELDRLQRDPTHANLQAAERCVSGHLDDEKEHAHAAGASEAPHVDHSDDDGGGFAAAAAAGISRRSMLSVPLPVSVPVPSPGPVFASVPGPAHAASSAPLASHLPGEPVVSAVLPAMPSTAAIGPRPAPTLIGNSANTLLNNNKPPISSFQTPAPAPSPTPSSGTPAGIVVAQVLFIVLIVVIVVILIVYIVRRASYGIPYWSMASDVVNEYDKNDGKKQQHQAPKKKPAQATEQQLHLLDSSGEEHDENILPPPLPHPNPGATVNLSFW